MDKKLFETNPRSYALGLVEDGLQSADHLLQCALNYMSHADVCKMLDNEELSPRFDEDEPEYLCPDCSSSVTFNERYNYYECDRDSDGADGCACYYSIEELEVRT